MAGGLGIRVHARPGAARTETRSASDPSASALKPSTASRRAPEDGKANAAIAKLLAGEWDVPKSRLRLVSGATDRRKFFVLTGEPAALAARLEGWLRQCTEHQ